MNKHTFKTLCIALFALAISACAATVQREVTQPVVNSSFNDNNVFISVAENPTYADNSRYRSSMRELISAIKTKNPSVQDLSGSPHEGITAVITVEDFKYISTAARFVGGIISGKARLQVRLDLSDLATGKKLGESRMGTTSNNLQGILGATTPRQIDAVAEQIATLLKNP